MIFADMTRTLSVTAGIATKRSIRADENHLLGKFIEAVCAETADDAPRAVLAGHRLATRFA